MNEFEIKAIIKNLKEYGIKNIYPISKEYNIDHYEYIQMHIVVEYEYKQQTYYQEVKFDSKEDNKAEYIKYRIKNHKEEIKEKLYNEKTPLRLDYINYFVREKIRLIQAVIAEKRVNIEGYSAQRVWQTIQNAIDKNMTIEQAYKKGLEQAKKEVGINE